MWRWECERGFCQKHRITPETRESALSLPVCRLFCSPFAGIWPQPTGKISLSNTLAHVDANTIEVLNIKGKSDSKEYVTAAIERFKKQLRAGIPRNVRASNGGKNLTVTLKIDDPNESLSLNTNEGYTLRVSISKEKGVSVEIAAPTFFGARHGLETLGQLIVYDDIRAELQIPTEIAIDDKPIYPYRGILLDTSRNYISVETIKRTLEGMAASKLNTFHWHITDSQSFPYVSKTRPELSQLGAYSPEKIYSPDDVKDIIDYAKERGIRVLPEFDAPAHVGEGWQDTGFVACFNKQPWQNYCVEPPCGQFDPTKPGLYDALQGKLTKNRLENTLIFVSSIDIYQDMMEQFQPDIFHMGGDEVSFSCWNTTENIVNWMTEKGWSRSEQDFVKLWDMFQKQALERLDKKNPKQIPVIMWTSTLTKKEYVAEHLPKDRYIIQIWTSGSDPQIEDLLNQGYKLILSNHDALYFDCGFAGWVKDGNNWCSPYIGWQKVYENSPAKIAGLYRTEQNRSALLHDLPLLFNITQLFISYF